MILDISQLSDFSKNIIKKAMPYKSEAQRKYFHAHEKELKAQGVNISEWDKASKGKKLPKKVKSKK